MESEFEEASSREMMVIGGYYHYCRHSAVLMGIRPFSHSVEPCDATCVTV